jgi:RNA polymerase-binding transcription factor DksA
VTHLAGSRVNHRVSQAVELENGETLVALDQELAQELVKIDKALERIEAGTYMDCASCGEPIGEERLKALPTSVQCIECAKEAAETAPRS